MTENMRDVVITGIGLVSSLGEGIVRHLDIIAGNSERHPVLEASAYAPYFVHPLPSIDWSKQIPKKGDQRQMETWQKLGTYAAGLALEDAAIPADESTRSKIDLVVAAGGGERDMSVDALVMDRVRGSKDPEPIINETLSSELRPTLFLAQLSNLLAGNISIVHKITGSSRTFMGEEAAGISAIASARARIASGQSDICLVGSAFSAERKDLLLNFDLASLMLRDEWSPIFARKRPHDGVAIGSVGAFVVLESAEHATARAALPYAKLSAANGDRGSREHPATVERLRALLPLPDGREEETLVLSGASGIADLNGAELEALSSRFANSPVRAYGTLLGHCFETQVPAGLALAAGALARGKPVPPFDGEEERPSDVAPRRAIVTSVGHLHAEGICVLEAVDGRKS